MPTECSALGLENSQLEPKMQGGWNSRGRRVGSWFPKVAGAAAAASEFLSARLWVSELWAGWKGGCPSPPGSHSGRESHGWGLQQRQPTVACCHAAVANHTVGVCKQRQPTVACRADGVSRLKT